MNPLSRIAGMAVDRMLGLPSGAAPYVVRPDVAVAMPDGVVLLGDHYRPAGDDRPLPVVLIRSPYGRAGLAGTLVRRAAGAAGLPGVHPEHPRDVRLGRPVPPVHQRAGGRPGHRGVAA